MDRHADVCRQRAHFNRQHALGDQFTSARSTNTDAKHALSLRIDQQFGQPFRPIKRDSAPRGSPRKLGHLDLASLFFGLSLGNPGPGNFRISKDHRRNRIGFECNFVPRNRFDRSPALMHRLVRQHRLAGHVANRVDGGIGRLPLLVDFDEPLSVDFDLCFVESGDLGIRPPAHRHQHAVEHLLLFLSRRRHQASRGFRSSRL